MDGWSNLRNEGIINFVISHPEPLFVKFVFTEDNRHTGQYLKEEMKKVLTEYNAQKFFVVIADNAKNVQNGIELLTKEEGFEHIIPLNCAAHTLHLLICDIIKIAFIALIVQNVINVIRFFRSSQVIRAKLQMQKKRKDNPDTPCTSLLLPCATRWGTVRQSFRSLLKNKYAILKMCIEPDSPLPEDKKNLLLDNQFWKKVEDIHNLLAPISDLIFELETDNVVIQKVYPAMKNLRVQMEGILSSSTFSEGEKKEDILALFDTRYKLLINPLHYAAVLLTPSDRGYSLSIEEQQVAMKFIHTVSKRIGLNTKILQELADYRSQQGSLWKKNESFVWENIEDVNPSSWWIGLCGSVALSRIAHMILTSPCTSAATERSFSTFSRIHTKLRNKLTTLRVSKVRKKLE